MTTHRFALTSPWSCALLVCTLLAGCASAPTARFHSLLSVTPSQARELPTIWAELEPIRLASAVDRTQWVVRTADNSMRILEQERWVSPLRDELHAALFEQLNQHWGATTDAALVKPPTPSWRIRVDINRFESVLNHETWLDSTWRITANNNSNLLLVCHSSFREPATGGVQALAQAHRRAVARLADHIGNRLTALNRGEKTACDSTAKQ